MSTTLTILPAEESDSYAIAEIEFSACAADPGFSTIFPLGASPETLSHFAQGVLSDIRGFADPTVQVMKVVAIDTDTGSSSASASGEIASFATWHFFPLRSRREAGELPDVFDLPPDANHEAGERLIRNGAVKRTEIMGGEAYAYLAALGTSPKFRRRGAASLLLEWGTKLADEKSLPCYVESTPAALSLYLKFSFQMVDTLKLDVSQWRRGEFWNVCMIRPFKPKS